jgi:hypothetical protein
MPTIESWRRHDKTVRPRGALVYKPPAPEIFLPAFAAPRVAAQFLHAAPPALGEANHCPSTSSKAASFARSFLRSPIWMRQRSTMLLEMSWPGQS